MTKLNTRELSLPRSASVYKPPKTDLCRCLPNLPLQPRKGAGRHSPGRPKPEHVLRVWAKCSRGDKSLSPCSAKKQKQFNRESQVHFQTIVERSSKMRRPKVHCLHSNCNKKDILEDGWNFGCVINMENFTYGHEDLIFILTTECQNASVTNSSSSEQPLSLSHQRNLGTLSRKKDKFYVQVLSVAMHLWKLLVFCNFHQ